MQGHLNRLCHFFVGIFAVLKREVRITFTPEDVDNFLKETKEMQALRMERSSNCIVRMKLYFLEKMKSFRKVTPKDVMVRDGD